MATKAIDPLPVSQAQQQNGVLAPGEAQQPHLLSSSNNRRPSATPPQNQNNQGSVQPPQQQQQVLNKPLGAQPQQPLGALFHQPQHYESTPTWALQPQPQQLYSMNAPEYNPSVGYYPFSSMSFAEGAPTQWAAFSYAPTSQPSSNPYAAPPPPSQVQQTQEHQSPYAGMSLPYATGGGLMDYVSQWTPSLDTSKPHTHEHLYQTPQQFAPPPHDQQHSDYDGLSRGVHHMNLGLGVSPAQQPPPVTLQQHNGAPNRATSWADRVKAAPREPAPRGRHRGCIAGNANRGSGQPPAPSQGQQQQGSAVMQQAMGKAPQAPPGWGPQRNVGPLVAMPPPSVPQQQLIRNGGWPQDGVHPQAIVMPTMSVRAPIGVVGPPINAHLAQNIEQQRMLELQQQQHNNNSAHGAMQVSVSQHQQQAQHHQNPVNGTHNQENGAGHQSLGLDSNQPPANDKSASAMVGMGKKSPQQSPIDRNSSGAAAAAKQPASTTTIEPVTATTTLEKLRRETNPRVLEMPPKNARYFVIKSYSEDDVHRSIKYGIWCSTDHGNKRLDQAFKQSQKPGQGPIYLFFSVNASGHFCGLAQMVSCVDYSKQSNVWGSDKYKGLFKVRWVYVKDVPNQQLRHIRLENNENKPVTNSRDTQEVPCEKGRLTLRVLHDYNSTTSLFDDFVHYEKKQMEEDSRRGRNSCAAPIVA